MSSSALTIFSKMRTSALARFVLRIHISFLLPSYGATAQIRPWPPLLRFLYHTIRHAVGFLWTSDQPVAEASTYTGQQHITQETNIHALSGTRNRDPSNQVAADLHLKPRGHHRRQSTYQHKFTSGGEPRFLYQHSPSFPSFQTDISATCRS
jgi:hypothetical protein